MEAVVARIEITRRAAADPASVALLLAEPASEREPERGVVAAAPRRSGVGFTSRVEIRDVSGRTVNGEVIVEPSVDAGCELRLRLWAADDDVQRDVERAGSAFLRELAARARSRSYAA
jgi:hypothetical protein